MSLVRNVLVREVEGGLALLTVVPESWIGQSLAVHDAPTHHGLFSFAVRWHGDRPALLWELKPHVDADARQIVEPVRFTAPGLDPAWSSTELRGDALLAPAGGAEMRSFG
jgi:hypothetical protein